MLPVYTRTATSVTGSHNNVGYTIYYVVNIRQNKLVVSIIIEIMS